jgi:hypothetical protein
MIVQWRSQTNTIFSSATRASERQLGKNAGRNHSEVDADFERAAHLAAMVAPYRHARLSAVKLAGDPNNPVHFKDDATADELRAEESRRCCHTIPRRDEDFGFAAFKLWIDAAGMARLAAAPNWLSLPEFSVERFNEASQPYTKARMDLLNALSEFGKAEFGGS